MNHEIYIPHQEATHAIEELEDVEFMGLVEQELGILFDTPIYNEEHMDFLQQSVQKIRSAIMMQAATNPIPVVQTRELRRLDLGKLK